MKFRLNSPVVGLFIVALIISLVVNFSYFLLLVVNQNDSYMRRTGRSNNGREAVTVSATGRLTLSVDGYGYIVTTEGDSIFVDRSSARRLGLSTGDELQVQASSQTSFDSPHFIMRHVDIRNGEEFDYGSLYDGSTKLVDTSYQLLYYLAVSFVMLMVMNSRRKGVEWSGFVKRSCLCTLIAFATYFIAPITLRHTGETIVVFQGRQMIDFVVMMKCLFVLVVVVLYSRIYELVYQRQIMMLENEQLKSDNLTTRYNMLVSQINPHFFFNSLNSLSMLVREKDEKRALEYIDQLSYTFRYITYNGNNTRLVSVRDELQFAEAYCYLFRIRYADKIFFDIDVDERYLEYQLPPLSLQPLIGNAVKHNAITARNPFRVRIYAENDKLVIANEIRPLLEPQVGTGTGLQNLSSRYKLILGREIEVEQMAGEFIVRLPLQTVERS